MSRSAEARYALKEAAQQAANIPLWNAHVLAAQQARAAAEYDYQRTFGTRPPHALGAMAATPPLGHFPGGQQLLPGQLPGHLGPHAPAGIGVPVGVPPPPGAALVPLAMPRGVSAVPGAEFNYLRAAPTLYAQHGALAGRLAEDADDPAWRRTPRLETHGNQETFNLNPLLANCVLNHDYSRKLWEMGDSFKLLLIEARDKVTHVEPWQQGTARTPSTAMCILVRFFQLGLHEGHVEALLSASEPALVRALGFLYLRYVCPPAQLWKWCEDTIYDELTAEPTYLAGGSSTTLSAWLRAVLTDQKYYGTILPRIPVKIEREIKVKLLLVDEAVSRARDNARTLDAFAVGAKVRAIYADETHEPAWYDAIIEGVDDGADASDVKGGKTKKGGGATTPPVGDDVAPQSRKFWVSFPEYGNQELVRLGDLDLLPDAKAAAKQRRQDTTTTTSNTTDAAGRDVPQRADDAGGPPRRSNDDDDDDDLGRSSRTHRRRRRDDDDDRRSRRRSRSRSPRRADGSRRRKRRDDDSDDDPQVRSRRRHHRDRSRSASPDRRGGYRDDRHRDARRDAEGPRTGESLLAGDRLRRVLQQERDAASSTSDYARRPQGYKEALALKIDRYTQRRVADATAPTTTAPSRETASSSSGGGASNRDGGGTSSKPSKGATLESMLDDYSHGGR